MNYRCGKNPLIFEVIPTQYGFMADILDFCYNNYTLLIAVGTCTMHISSTCT